MPQPSTFELLLAGALVAVMLFFWFPGIRQALARSRSAPRDWPAALIPVGVVVLFVVLLMASMRA